MIEKEKKKKKGQEKRGGRRSNLYSYIMYREQISESKFKILLGRKEKKLSLGKEKNFWEKDYVLNILRSTPGQIRLSPSDQRGGGKRKGGDLWKNTSTISITQGGAEKVVRVVLGKERNWVGGWNWKIPLRQAKQVGFISRTGSQ